MSSPHVISQEDALLAVAAVVQLAFALLGVAAAVVLCCTATTTTDDGGGRWDGVRSPSPPLPPPSTYRTLRVQYPPSWGQHE